MWATVGATGLADPKPVASTTTDANGLFDFEVPGGQYLIVAAKHGGFLETEYGQTGPGQPGRVVAVESGRETSVEIALIRAGVISGRVFDEAGDPLPSAAVSAVRQQTSGEDLPRAPTFPIVGQPPPGRAESVSVVTNDRGEFRIFGLMPGEYLLYAVPRVERSTAARPTPTYFPGVSDPGAATRLQLDPAQEFANADFTIRRLMTLAVSGIALDPEGQPLTSGSVTLQVHGLEGLAGIAQIGTIRQDGTFSFTAVPGQYVLRARSPVVGGPNTARAGDLSLALPLTIGESDTSGLVLRLTRGATLSGRIVFEGSGRPARPEQFRVLIESGSPGAIAGASCNEDGTFVVRGIEAGARRVMASAPSGWVLKAIFINGQDVSDSPVEFREDVMVPDVRAVFTDLKPTLTVAVHPETDRGTAVIVVFPADPAAWHDRSRRLVTRAVGREPVVVDSLPAGDYLVAAIAGVAERSLRPVVVRFLARLRPLALHTQLLEGAGTAVEVRVVPLPR
jgi:hypothetical protein